jgi:hypothetical protein
MSKRVFIAFALEDKKFRDFVVGQSKLDKSPFEFIDMSVKEPWDEKWKTNCRTRIRVVTEWSLWFFKNTAKADGQLWEIQCAYDEEARDVDVRQRGPARASLEALSEFEPAKAQLPTTLGRQ